MDSYQYVVVVREEPVDVESAPIIEIVGPFPTESAAEYYMYQMSAAWWAADEPVRWGKIYTLES